MAKTSFNQIRLHKNRPASRPPVGSVDVFWDTQSNSLRSIADSGDPIPVYDVGGTVPVQWKAAVGTLDPAGSNNNIVLTAPLGIGAAGNSISAISLISSGGEAGLNRYPIVVKRTVDSISIVCGDRNRMTVGGTLNSGSVAVTFGILTYGGMLNSKPFFTNGGVSIASSTHRVQWDGTKWILSTGSSSWTSIHDVIDPASVQSGAWNATTNPNGWRPTAPATGTPTFTGATALASQAIQAINNANVGVTAANAPSNSGAGLMAYATVNLSTGITGTPAPPQIRITNGKIYTFSNGLWYESNSTLVV